MQNKKEHIQPWLPFKRKYTELKTQKKLMFNNSNINVGSYKTASYKVTHQVED